MQVGIVLAACGRLKIMAASISRITPELGAGTAADGQDRQGGLAGLADEFGAVPLGREGDRGHGLTRHNMVN